MLIISSEIHVFPRLSLVRLDANDYAEVEFYETQSYIPSMDYLGFAECTPMRLLPKTIHNHQIKPRKQNSPSNGIHIAPLSNTNNSNAQISSVSLQRDCNVDVDPKHLSDRREWATAHYHSFYNPHCLFELEIRWLVATSSILGDLIMQWSQRTGTIVGSHQVAFHLVPIPCDPFAELDALRGNNVKKLSRKNYEICISIRIILCYDEVKKKSFIDKLQCKIVISSHE